MGPQATACDCARLADTSNDSSVAATGFLAGFWRTIELDTRSLFAAAGASDHAQTGAFAHTRLRGMQDDRRSRPCGTGIAVAMRCYQAHRALLAGAQRLLWASTGTKDPAARDRMYIEALAASDTINTIPEPTLLAFADHGQPGAVMPADGGRAEAVLDELRREGVDDEALAAQLQRDGVLAFAESWGGLLARIRDKSRESVATAATGQAAPAKHPQ